MPQANGVYLDFRKIATVTAAIIGLATAGGLVNKWLITKPIQEAAATEAAIRDRQYKEIKAEIAGLRREASETAESTEEAATEVVKARHHVVNELARIRTMLAEIESSLPPTYRRRGVR
jgi:esterase/lipase